MKTAIISGASRGIGKAIAISLAQEGYVVIVGFCKNKEKAQQVCRQIINNGGIAEAYKCDVSNNNDIKNIIEYTKNKYSQVDIVVANAGIGAYGLLIDHSDQMISDVVGVNLIGCITLCREASKVMLEQKSGNIVTISSMWGQVGGSCESVYSATKGGIIAFSKALAKELATSGIRVNCICPGFVDTDINANLSEEEKMQFVEEIPLQRAGQAQDVADTVVWLTSEKSSYVTGQIIGVNGGLVI